MEPNATPVQPQQQRPVVQQAQPTTTVSQPQTQVAQTVQPQAQRVVPTTATQQQPQVAQQTVQPQQRQVVSTPQVQTVQPVIAETNDLEEFEEFVEEEVKPKKEKKSFFKDAFTIYLPATLAIIGIVIYMCSSFAIIIDAISVAEWITFVARVVAVSGLVVETVRQIKAKKFEFNPTLVIVLLIVFVIM